MKISRAISFLFTLFVMFCGGGMTWYMKGFIGPPMSITTSTPRSMFFSMSGDATEVLTAATQNRSAVQIALSDSARRCLTKIQGNEVPSALLDAVSGIYRKIPEMPAIKNHEVPSGRQLDRYLTIVSSLQVASLNKRLRNMSDFSRLKLAVHMNDLAEKSSEHAECTYSMAYAQLKDNGTIQSN